MLRFLVHSQKSLTSNITQLFKSLSAVEKFKGDQKVLQELIKEFLDRTGLHADQILNLQQATSDLRHHADTQGNHLTSLASAVDNQSDLLTQADRQIAEQRTRQERLSEALDIARAEGEEREAAMRRRVDEWGQEVKRLEERARLYEDRIIMVERERLPQIETTVRNMNVFLDLQRDIVARMKDTETSTLATLEQANKKLDEFVGLAKET